MTAAGSGSFWSTQAFDCFLPLEDLHQQLGHSSTVSSSTGMKSLATLPRHNSRSAGRGETFGRSDPRVGGSAGGGGPVLPFCELDMTKIVRVVENEKMRMLCPLCPKSVRDKFNLRYHYMSVHSGERPMSCNFCSYRCITRQDLQSHFVCQHSRHLGITEHPPTN